MSSLGDLLLAHAKPSKTEKVSDNNNKETPNIDHGVMPEKPTSRDVTETSLSPSSHKVFPERIEKNELKDKDDQNSNASSTDDYVRELLDPDDRPRNVWHVVEGPKTDDQGANADLRRPTSSHGSRDNNSENSLLDHPIKTPDPNSYEDSRDKDSLTLPRDGQIDHPTDTNRGESGHQGLSDHRRDRDEEAKRHERSSERHRSHRDRSRDRSPSSRGHHRSERSRDDADQSRRRERDKGHDRERDRDRDNDRERERRHDRDRDRDRRSHRLHRSSRRRDYSDDEDGDDDRYRRSSHRSSRSRRSRSRSKTSSRRRERSRSNSQSPITKRNSRTILIMQLNPRVSSRDLEDLFSTVGRVKEVRLIMDSRTRRHKGIAYIEFEDTDSANKAAALNGQEFLGSPMVIQSALMDKGRSMGDWHSSNSHSVNQFASHSSSRSNLPPNSYRVYVGNLHVAITEDMIRSVFEPFGPIIRLELMRDRVTNISRGYAFITYANTEDGQSAVQNLNGLELGGKPIRVSKSTDKSERSSGQDGAHGSSVGHHHQHHQHDGDSDSRSSRTRDVTASLYELAGH